MEEKSNSVVDHQGEHDVLKATHKSEEIMKGFQVYPLLL